jgi:UDP-N-acetylglucosamine 4,6-dehydratase
MISDFAKQELEGREILVIGGTGSLGKTLVKLLKTQTKPKGIRIFSRDEFKQFELRNELQALGLCDNVAFLIGDMRDEGRLRRAMRGVNIVYHCAAMKQVPACEENPTEAIKTNILGAINIIESSVVAGVDVVMNISTDKAVSPQNTYGMTKALAERLFIDANREYSVHAGKPYFSCCRYGNVINSRGSVIPFFKKQRETGRLTITDYRMTRFLIELEEVASFVINRSVETLGGDIFVPEMESVSILKLAQMIAPECVIDEIGIRQGEKIHEVLISEDESIHAIKHQDFFQINKTVNGIEPYKIFEYTSDNAKRMSEDRIKEIIK